MYTDAEIASVLADYADSEIDGNFPESDPRKPRFEPLFSGWFKNAVMTTALPAD